jgi:signal transduction histidine kinase
MNKPVPSKPARRSLRSQLLNRLLPPLLTLFAISGALAYVAAWHHADEVQDRWLVDSAEALAQRVKLTRGVPTLDLPEAARQILQWDPEDTIWYEVWGERSGHIAGHTSVPGQAQTGGQRLRQAVMYDGWISGDKVRVATLPVDLQGAGERVEVRLAETLRKRQRLAAEMLLSVLLPQLALALVAWVVIWFTLQQLLSPIGEVARALEAQTHHSLEPVDDRALPAEVSPLTQSVNDLLLRLKDAIASQRHFIADAAHQLRTPLTALKLHADEAARESDPTRLKPLIDEVQRAADRAVRLSNQLLTLARAEPSARVAQLRVFDLRPVVIEAAGSWVPRAIDEGIDLGFGLPLEAQKTEGIEPKDTGPAWVSGDPDLLAEAVHNLIDNALRYGGSGRRITVSIVDGAGDRIQVRVDDNGPGIAQPDRLRVLERFHRVAVESPALRSQVVGSGLGLAIVSEIAGAHGGTVRIEDGQTGQGVCVVIDLPRASDMATGSKAADPTPAPDGPGMVSRHLPADSA